MSDTANDNGGPSWAEQRWQQSYGESQPEPEPTEAEPSAPAPAPEESGAEGS